MNSSKLKAIIFDLDGTLINSNEFHFQALKRTCKLAKINVTRKQVFLLYGEHTLMILSHLLSRKHFSKSTLLELRRIKREFAHDVLPSKSLIYPGIEKTLSLLEKRFKLAIATGSNRQFINEVLPEKFQNHFHAIISSNDYKKPKPNPEPLMKALKKLKIKKENALFVGDGLLDAQAAKNTKINFIGIKSGIATKKQLTVKTTLAVLKSVNELSALLK